MVLRLIDLEGVHYAAEAPTIIDEELNSDSMLSVTFQSTKTNERFISDLSELWKISGVKGLGDDTEYVINFLTRQGKGNKMIAHVKAIPKMFDDLAKIREYERFDQSFTAHNFFNLVFKDTPYTYALLDSFSALRFEGLGEGDQKIEMFKHGVNRFGMEFEIVGNEVRMRKRIERDVPYQLRWRLNASDIQEEIDATAFVTYAKGYGDYGDGEGGEDWQNANLIREYTSPLAAIPGIGIRHAEPIKNGNITDKDTMDANLKKLVDESLKVSVTSGFHRLKSYPYAEPKKGDLIHLIDERIGFKRKVRVIKVLTHRDIYGNITNQDVTFGDVGITKRHQAKLNTTVNTLDKIMSGKQKIPFSVLDDAVLAATKALQNAQTELLFPDSGGIHAVDKNDPNKLVVYNSAGLGISDDGGMTFKTAITGDGIVADVITAGTLRGIDIIGTNIISFNPDNENVVTLADGEITTFSNGKQRFGVYGDGLVAYHWVTEQPVATFRADHVDNTEFGAGINAMGDYFHIGRQVDEGGTSHSQLYFDWAGSYDRAYLYGGSKLRDSGQLTLKATSTGGSANGSVPEIELSNNTESGTAWSRVSVYVGRDNRKPTTGTFRSGFEIWQYEGDGEGGVIQLFKIDKDSTADGSYANILTDKTNVDGYLKMSSGGESYGHLDMHGWDLKDVGRISVGEFGTRGSSSRVLEMYNTDGFNTGTTSRNGVSLRRNNGNGGIFFHGNAGALMGGADGNFSYILAGSDSSSGYIQSTTVASRTYDSAPNLYITGNGVIGRSTSSRRYKLNEKPISIEYARKIYGIDMKSWNSKRAVEEYAYELSNPDDEHDFEQLKITRNPGFIAEDLHDAGLTMFVEYNDADQPDAISSNLSMLAFPLLKEHEGRLNEYDARFGTVEEKIVSLQSQINELKGVA